MQRPANGEAGWCDHCDRDCPRGPDVCIGRLDGVTEACCGHGWATTPYVQIGETRLEGRAAIDWFDVRDVGPPPVQTVSVQMFDMYDHGITVKAEYDCDSLRLNAVRWVNLTEHEPRWAFDGVEVTLTNGKGTVPLPELFCRETVDGLVDLPFSRVEVVGGG